MKEIQVIGHKNPDTDATLSAIIMADFLTKKWYTAIPFIQGKLNKETLYILEKYNISQPEIKTSLDAEKETALVDHNENSQAPDNISSLNITWLIDHHKINFSSTNPLYIRIEPLCSTASVLYKMYKEENFEITKEIAIMMLACMMSDSLLWKSPTSTDEDKKIALKLQEISGITDIEAFAMPMFEAKSDLGDMPILDVIQYDYKIFETNGKRFAAGSLETTNPGYAFGRKKEILEWLKTLKKDQNLDFIMLSVVDILQENNKTFVLTEDAEILERVFWGETQENIIDLGKRISRKKQIAPDLTSYFENN